MKALRTPDERFVNLPGYAYAPHYLEVGEGLRLHYLDEPPAGKPARDAETIVLLHGEPSWSYLYRKMIPPLTAAGYRVLAPDLIGFGKSDKPRRLADYSYQLHLDWLSDWLRQVDVQGATMFCQDWGSLLGLRLAAEQGERFQRIVVGNGFLPIANTPVPLAFKLWRGFARHSPLFPIGRIVASGCVSKLSRAEIAAYDAPYPDARYKAGARAFPRLVPTREDDPATAANRAAWSRLGAWHKPFLCLFGQNDPILGRADAPLIAHIPGARGQPHERFWGGHFVQEDRGDYLAERMIAWMRSTPIKPA